MDNAKELAKSTIAIITFSLIGKILAFVRESLQAAQFGATDEMDAFVASQAITAIVSALITGAIATTFIPAFQKAELEYGEKSRNKFTNNMLFMATLFSLLLICVGIFFAPQLTLLIATNTKPEIFDLVVKLVRIGMPVIIFSAWVGVFTGFLQYQGKFVAAGAVAIPLNIVYIVYLTAFANKAGIIGLTLVSVLGIVAQLFFLLPHTFRQGYRPRVEPKLNNKFILEAFYLSLPVFLSTAVNDINIIVNKRLAMEMASGSASVLNYANKMNTMIIGIFITAITAIIFPTMSRAFGTNNMIQGKRVMSTSVKSVLFLTVPATIGMLILARPIVDVAFLRGAFTKENAIETTATLQLYSLALISISVSNVLNRVYYSISDTKTPFIVGLINVTLNIGLNLLVAHKFGTRGLAASVSISTTIAVLMSFVLLRRKIGNLGTKSYIKALIKTVMASTAMGIVAFAYYPIESLILPLINGNKIITLTKFFILLIVVGIAVLIYFVAMYLLGVKEIKDIVKIIRNKVGLNS